MAGHNSPSYFKIYLLLLALFIVSVLGPEVADKFHLTGATRMIVVLTTAFGIALVKAYYVCAHFMHLKFEKIYAPYLLLTCVALMFLFFFGVSIDAMRSEGHNWEKVYQEPKVAAGEHPDHESEGHADPLAGETSGGALGH